MGWIMSKTKYWEVYCDTCSTAIGHYENAGMIYREVKAVGGHTRGVKHYCSDECLEATRKPKDSGSE